MVHFERKVSLSILKHFIKICLHSVLFVVQWLHLHINIYLLFVMIKFIVHRSQHIADSCVFVTNSIHYIKRRFLENKSYEQKKFSTTNLQKNENNKTSID